MTALAELRSLRRLDREFAVTNELRTQGTDSLLAAAAGAGTRRVVAQRVMFLTESRPPRVVRRRSLRRVTIQSPRPARLPSRSRVPSGSTCPAVTRSARARAARAVTSVPFRAAIRVTLPVSMSAFHPS